MKHSETVNVISYLLDAVPARAGVDLSNISDMARVWHEVLGDLPVESVQYAVAAWLRTQKFFPYPAEIRRRAIVHMASLPDAATAWEIALVTARSGDLTVWEQTHPVIAGALRDIGGARAVNESTDLTWIHKAFVEAYEARILRIAEAPDVTQLPGIMPALEASNGEPR